MPPPASQMEKPKGWWSRPSLPSEPGVRPNSVPQTTSVSSSRPRCLRSLSRPAIGWSVSRQRREWPPLRLLCASQAPAPPLLPWKTWMNRTPPPPARRAPGHRGAEGGGAPPAGREALSAEGAGDVLVEAVEPLRGGVLLLELHHLGDRGLHPERQLVALDAGPQVGVGGVLDGGVVVQPVQQLELALLLLPVNVTPRRGERQGGGGIDAELDAV